MEIKRKSMFLVIFFIIIPDILCCSLNSDLERQNPYNYQAKVKKFICVNPNPDVIRNVSCFLKPHDHDNQSVNTYISLMPNVELTVIKAQLSAYYKTTSNDFDKLFVSTKEDICMYLSGDISNAKYFRTFRKEFALHGNMDHPCPYSGDLFLKNWMLENCALESYVPQGNWQLSIQFFTTLKGNEVPMLKMIFYIDVRTDLGAEHDDE